MASVNKVILLGNVGKKEPIRYMPNGDGVTNVNLATNESWKDKATGEKKEHTEWHRVTFMGKLAEIANQYLQVGSSIYLEGQLRTRKYKDRDGIEKFATDIRVETMQMLGSPQANANAGHTRAASTPRPNAAGGGRPASAPSFSDMDDDIPF